MTSICTKWVTSNYCTNQNHGLNYAPIKRFNKWLFLKANATHTVYDFVSSGKLKLVIAHSGFIVPWHHIKLRDSSPNWIGQFWNGNTLVTILSCSGVNLFRWQFIKLKLYTLHTHWETESHISDCLNEQEGPSDRKSYF